MRLVQPKSSQRIGGGNRFAGLYLYGTPGTGKTHAALGIGRLLHDAGADVFYRFAPSLDNRPERLTFWTGINNGPLKERTDGFLPASNVFKTTQRNPKTVLIFDEYKPDKQKHLYSAVEAAAQYGGLIIVTSNFADPFKPLEVQTDQPADTNGALNEALLAREAPEVAQGLSVRRQEAAEAISQSLRSRIAASFKHIPFTGPDRRLENGFWDS